MSARKYLDMDRRILAALKTNGLSMGELATACDAPRKALTTAFNKLLAAGEIFAAGGGSRRRYALTQQAANVATLAVRAPVQSHGRDPERKQGAVVAAGPEEIFDLTPPKPFLDAANGTKIRLPIFRADEVQAGDELFYCPRFQSAILGRSCVERQRLAGDAVSWVERRGRGGGGSGTPVSPITYRRCLNCSVGSIVVDRLEKARAA